MTSLKQVGAIRGLWNSEYADGSTSGLQMMSIIMFLCDNCYTYMAEYSRIIVIEKRLHHRHGPRGVQCVCMFSQLIMNTAGSQNCNPVICMLMYTSSSAMVVYTCSDVCKNLAARKLSRVQLDKYLSWPKAYLQPRGCQVKEGALRARPATQQCSGKAGTGPRLAFHLLLQCAQACQN